MYGRSQLGVAKNPKSASGFATKTHIFDAMTRSLQPGERRKVARQTLTYKKSFVAGLRRHLCKASLGAQWRGLPFQVFGEPGQEFVREIAQKGLKDDFDFAKAGIHVVMQSFGHVPAVPYFGGHSLRGLFRGGAEFADQGFQRFR